MHLAEKKKENWEQTWGISVSQKVREVFSKSHARGLLPAPKKDYSSFLAVFLTQCWWGIQKVFTDMVVSFDPAKVFSNPCDTARRLASIFLVVSKLSYPLCCAGKPSSPWSSLYYDQKGGLRHQRPWASLNLWKKGHGGMSRLTALGKHSHSLRISCTARGWLGSRTGGALTA